jgi:FeS assembly SUF system protein
MEETRPKDGEVQLSSIEQGLIYHQAVDAIKTCYDPEIPVNIYELGLVYDVKVAADGGVLVVMTLTTPHCPAAQTLPREVEARVRSVPGVTAVRVEVVWDPPWNTTMMSEAARLELGM